MTQRSRAGYASEIGTELPNNSSRSISAQDVRDNLTDLADSVPWYDEVLYPDATSEISVGYTIDPYAIGTVSSGTTTLDIANGGMQTITNDGAFTLAAPSSGSGTVILEVTNGASAGTVTFSGFVTGAPDGDSLDTVEGNHFEISIRKFGSRTTATISSAPDNS